MDLHPYRLRPALRRTASTLRRFFWKALKLAFWGAFFGASWHLGNTVVGPAIGPSWAAWWNSEDAPKVTIERRLDSARTTEFMVYVKECSSKWTATSFDCKNAGLQLFGTDVLMVEGAEGIYLECSAALPPAQMTACTRSGWRP